MYHHNIATCFFFLCNSILVLFLALGLVFSVNKFAFKVITLCHLMVFNSFGAPLPLLFIPHIIASPQSGSFPSIDFKDFSDFILGNFGPKISVPTVITLLLSMTNNTELLYLQFKQAEKGG